MQMPVYALGDDEPDIHELAYVAPDAVVIGLDRIEHASVTPPELLEEIRALGLSNSAGQRVVEALECGKPAGKAVGGERALGNLTA